MVLSAGYLSIYNTLYISISKDIRYYGQLKTIGMTNMQLTGLVYRQALWNALAGIPVGLLAGRLLAGTSGSCGPAHRQSNAGRGRKSCPKDCRFMWWRGV